MVYPYTILVLIFIRELDLGSEDLNPKFQVYLLKLL